MIEYDTIPERGDFSYQTLAGPHKVTGKALNNTRGFFGLTYSKTSVFGCLYTDDGETFAGSTFVVVFDTLDEAKAWAAEDPYAKAGLFETVEIRPFRWLLGGGRPE